MINVKSENSDDSDDDEDYTDADVNITTANKQRVVDSSDVADGDADDSGDEDAGDGGEEPHRHRHPLVCVQEAPRKPRAIMEAGHRARFRTTASSCPRWRTARTRG